MSYIINKTNGQLLLTLLDGTADGPQVNPGLNTTDINLFGKNYTNFGEFQNENFVKLLENFSNSTPPTKPITGQLWYDTVNKFLKVYDGTKFVSISPLIVSATSPATTTIGANWWDTTNDQLKVYTGSGFALIGPAYSKVDGKSGALVETVYDQTEQPHAVVKLYNSGNVTAIVSYDPVFTPNAAITGFPTITPGINLNTTNSSLFTGTATNAQLLDNITPAQFARKDIEETFASNINIVSGELTISSSTDAKITNTVLNGNVSIYTNVNGISTNALNVDGSTGLITVASEPTNISGIATKGYVDAHLESAVAPLATSYSPTFSGTAVSVTPDTADSSTRIATTAFTKAAIAASDNSLWTGSGKTISDVPPTSLDGDVGDFWFQI